jgi:hypothetical protein
MSNVSSHEEDEVCENEPLSPCDSGYLTETSDSED